MYSSVQPPDGMSVRLLTGYDAAFGPPLRSMTRYDCRSSYSAANERLRFGIVNVFVMLLAFASTETSPVQRVKA